MKNTILGLILMSLTSQTFAVLPDPAEVVKADCYHTGFDRLTQISRIIGAGNDIKFYDEQKGIIDLNLVSLAHPVPSYKGVQKIDLGHNYTLNLQLDFSTATMMGPKIFDNPYLIGAALLKFKNKIVSSAAVRTDRAISQYIDGTGEKFYKVEFTLHNTLLREELGVTDDLDANVAKLLNTSEKQEELFSSLGDGQGILIDAQIHCKVSAIQ